MTVGDDLAAARRALINADAAARHALDAVRVVAVHRGLDRGVRDLRMPMLRMSSASNHLCSMILALVESKVAGTGASGGAGGMLKLPGDLE